jgi:hypothetical protein
MNTNHTPGPWVINHHAPSSVGSAFWEITDGIDKPVAFINEPQPRSREEMEANAKLMAAAPELLTELKNLLATARVVDAGNKNQYGKDCCGFAAECFDQAAAAIAKAEGSAA